MTQVTVKFIKGYYHKLDFLRVFLDPVLTERQNLIKENRKKREIPPMNFTHNFIVPIHTNIMSKKAKYGGSQEEEEHKVQ